MLTTLRLSLLLLLLLLTACTGWDRVPLLVLPLLSCVFLYSRQSVKLSQITQGHLFIIPFALTFSLFSFFQDLIIGSASPVSALLLFLKTVIIFTILMSGRAWIGTGGLLVLMRLIPFGRSRLFLILLVRFLRQFIKNNTLILHQLRARLDLNIRSRLTVARYYFSNLILKELYALHLTQAALVLRVEGPPRPHAPDIPWSATDWAALLFSCSFAFALYLGL